MYDIIYCGENIFIWYFEYSFVIMSYISMNWQVRFIFICYIFCFWFIHHFRTISIAPDIIQHQRYISFVFSTDLIEINIVGRLKLIQLGRGTTRHFFVGSRLQINSILLLMKNKKENASSAGV